MREFPKSNMGGDFGKRSFLFLNVDIINVLQGSLRSWHHVRPRGEIGRGSGSNRWIDSMWRKRQMAAADGGLADGESSPRRYSFQKVADGGIRVAEWSRWLDMLEPDNTCSRGFSNTSNRDFKQGTIRYLQFKAIGLTKW